MDEVEFDWDLAEYLATPRTPVECTECDEMWPHGTPRRPGYCDIHRCAAVTEAGTRCKNVVANTNPMYCATHVCGAYWVEKSGAGTVTTWCASEGRMRDLPGGRGRVCDHHRDLIWLQAMEAADA